MFALNPQQDPSVNLLAILVGAGILQLWAWPGQVVGLQIAFYYKKKMKICMRMVYTSVTIVFVTFIIWDCFLPQLPAIEAHYAVEESA